MPRMLEDVLLCYYAIANGFTVNGPPMDMSAGVDGIPEDTLTFHKEGYDVWLTERGWRIGRKFNGVYENSRDGDYFEKLRRALYTVSRRLYALNTFMNGKDSCGRYSEPGVLTTEGIDKYGNYYRDSFDGEHSWRLVLPPAPDGIPVESVVVYNERRYYLRGQLSKFS